MRKPGDVELERWTVTRPAGVGSVAVLAGPRFSACSVLILITLGYYLLEGDFCQILHFFIHCYHTGCINRITIHICISIEALLANILCLYCRLGLLALFLLQLTSPESIQHSLHFIITKVGHIWQQFEAHLYPLKGKSDSWGFHKVNNSDRERELAPLLALHSLHL